MRSERGWALLGQLASLCDGATEVVWEWLSSVSQPANQPANQPASQPGEAPLDQNRVAGLAQAGWAG